MSNYLELLEVKRELGLASKQYFSVQEKFYNGKGVNQKVKDNYDKSAEKQLALFKQDKTSFLTMQLFSQVKATNENTKSIKGWVTFMGVMAILGLIGAIITVIEL